MKKLQKHLNWLNSWENEKKAEVSEIVKKRGAAIKIVREKQKLVTKGRTKSKEDKDEEKEAINNIKKQYKPLILRKRILFLSDSTSQGLRMTITSIIYLVTFLLNEIKVDYELTRELNQDGLEVIIFIIL